jgi:hypothetical protein
MSKRLSVFPFPEMRKVLPAAWMLGLLVRCRSGRRREKLELMARTRIHTPEEGNSARVTEMPPRSERRARVKALRKSTKKATRLAGNGNPNRHELREAIPFRPVYGHGIKPKEPHADTIAFLVTKNHDTAAKYAEACAAERTRTKAAQEVVASFKEFATAGNQAAAQ